MKKTTPEFSESNIIRIALTAHTVPDVKEIANGEFPYVLFGFDQNDRSGKERNMWRNQFPQYLVWLLNRSAIHNAIVTGKAQYITAKGFVSEMSDLLQKVKLETLLKNFNQYETANEILYKSAFDFELHNGIALRIIGDAGKKNWAEVCHEDFGNWRSNHDRTEFYYTKDWSVYNPDENKDWEVLPAYDPNKWQKESLLYYTGYRPNLKVYPFPDYVGALGAIESDYEITNFHLNNLKNGFTAGTVISFNNGTPKEENKAAVESGLKKKFTGTDNTNSTVFIFSDGKDKEPSIFHLQPSDIDKQFDLLSKSVEQKILTGHKITNPLLFGIKTEGQLGGREEMSDSWELFQNNYISHRQNIISKIFNDLIEARGYPRCLSIQRTEPIGLGLSDEMIAGVMTKDEIRERAGLPKLTPEQKAAINPDATVTSVAQDAVPVNDNIKNLSAKQHQQLLRIIRQFGKGQLTKEAATTLLKTSLGLTDDDINSLLGVTPEQFEAHFENIALSNKEMIAVFAEFGVSKDEYNSISSKRVLFSDEQISTSEKFAATTTSLQTKILQLVKKDPLISEENLAKALKVTEDEIVKAIDLLVEEEYLKRSEKKTVTGTVPSLEVSDDGNNAITENKTLTIAAMYDYRKREGVKGDTLLPTSRDFCKTMIELNRYYSRADIEKISQRLGYSVFDFAGGFWNDNGDTHPYCRHSWYMNLVRKK